MYSSKGCKDRQACKQTWTSSMTVQLCDTCSGRCGKCCHVAGLTGARLHNLNCGKVVKMNCTCGVACETVLIKTFLPRGTMCPVLPAQEENNRSEGFPSSFSVQHRHVLCLHCKMATPLKGLQKKTMNDKTNNYLLNVETHSALLNGYTNDEMSTLPCVFLCHVFLFLVLT